MCSASMNFAPSRFASISNWSATCDEISHETSSGASLCAPKSLFTIPPPQLDLSHQQAPQMLLVDGLPRDPKGFSHLRPGPARPHSPFDLGVLEPVCDRSQRGGGSQAVGRAVKRRWSHSSNCSCLSLHCQL